MFNGLCSNLSSLVQSVPSPGPLTDEQQSVYQKHGISKDEANLINQSILYSSKVWALQQIKGGYVESCPTIPRSLFYYKNHQHMSGIETMILLNDKEVGRGRSMRYVQALESSSLKTYVFGLVMIKGRKHNGKWRSAKYFSKTANQLIYAFKRVGHHPSIVHLHAALTFAQKVGEYQVPFCGFVFDYYELGDLEKYVERGPALEGREIKQICVDIARALEYMHSLGMAHYDVKEANILLTRNQDGELCAKLGDLGFAKGADSYTGCGTPIYLPPEFWMAYPHQSGDFKLYDGRRFDMWAFAVVIKWLVDKHHFIPDSVVNKIESMSIEVISPEKVQRGKIARTTLVSQIVRKMTGKKIEKGDDPIIDVEPEIGGSAGRAKRVAGFENVQIMMLKNLYLEESLYPKVVSSENDTLYRLYCQMLQFDPRERPASMKEVLTRLKTIHGSESKALDGK